MRNELRSIIEEWNPWWDTGTVPDYLVGERRKVTEQIMNLMGKTNWAKAIIGPRRSGKTTVMYQVISDIVSKSPESVLYLNLEDPRLDRFTLTEIYKEYMTMQKPGEAHIFLDEVHHKNEWARWIRTRIDLHSNDNIIVSGSTSHLISKDVSHLLAGRVFLTYVYPFSFSEVLGIHGVKPRGEKGRAISQGVLEECLHWGCYPSVVLEKDTSLKTNKLLSYFETVISRDIATSHDLDAEKSKEIFRYVLKNTGDLTSVNKIKNIFKISYETAEKYLTAMKDAMVVLESRRYAFSLKEQMAFPRKFYPVDLGLRKIGIPQTHKDIGKLLETFIAQELVKAGFETYYLSNGSECDIVVAENGVPVYALQVTAQMSSKNKERELKGLELARDKLKIHGEIITYENTSEFLYLLGNGEKVFK